MPKSNPNSFPKAPCPDTITLRVRASIYESWGGHKCSVLNRIHLCWHCRYFRIIPEQRLVMLPFSKRRAFSPVLMMHSRVRLKSLMSEWKADDSYPFLDSPSLRQLDKSYGPSPETCTESQCLYALSAGST